MKEEGRIEHHIVDADYDDACLEGAFIVIGATNLDDVNKRVAEDAGKRGIMVNIADDPARYIRENNREGIKSCIRDIAGLDVELTGIG